MWSPIKRLASPWNAFWSLTRRGCCAERTKLASFRTMRQWPWTRWTTSSRQSHLVMLELAEHSTWSAGASNLWIYSKLISSEFNTWRTKPQQFDYLVDAELEAYEARRKQRAAVVVAEKTAKKGKSAKKWTKWMNEWISYNWQYGTNIFGYHQTFA